MRISQSQLTKLGDRLRAGVAAEDLRLLDEYRRSFADASDAVAERIREHLQVQPSQRSAKSTRAIIEKLQRQTCRLGQIQDIAGCRIVVQSQSHQDEVVRQVCGLFASADVDDRRARPSWGYRAVHVIVRQDGRLIEVQVRSELQHLWAMVSEALADQFGNELKYGGGSIEVRELLDVASEQIAQVEQLEARWQRREDERPIRQLDAESQVFHERLKSGVSKVRADIADLLNKALTMTKNGTW